MVRLHPCPSGRGAERRDAAGDGDGSLEFMEHLVGHLGLGVRRRLGGRLPAS
jgi:hypothetical protein